MSDGVIGIVVVVLGIPAFVAFFLFITWILALVSGWRHLAAGFRAREPFRGPTFGLSSARVGWVNYNNCLTVGANREGLSLKVIFPFSVVSPPLFFPWSVLGATSTRIFFQKFVEFEVRDAAGVHGSFALRRGLAEDLARASQGRLALDG